MPTQGPYDVAVERMHEVDPADWSWNESWMFSFIDLNGGPAGIFRVGITPNQQRAMLWMFVHADGGWYVAEESRLPLGGFDITECVSYDQWALGFSWLPETPLGGGRFTFSGYALARSGNQAGARLPLTIDLHYLDVADVHGTGIGEIDEARTAYPHGRFEQSLEANGTVTIGDKTYQVQAGAHRDKSWGPREWRQEFSMGDLQGPGRQLYFVGRSFPEMAVGYLRQGTREPQVMTVVDGSIDFDDGNRTIHEAHMVFEKSDGDRIDVRMKPVTPSIIFDIAHTVDVPESWLYYRNLVTATVSIWDEPVRGWFESSRYGKVPY